MKNAIATAIATDSYKDGSATAYLVPFKSKRNGETVTLYRWKVPAQGWGSWSTGLRNPCRHIQDGAKQVAASPYLSNFAAI